MAKLNLKIVEVEIDGNMDQETVDEITSLIAKAIGSEQRASADETMPASTPEGEQPRKDD